MAFWKPGASKLSGESLEPKNGSKEAAAPLPKPKLSKGVLGMKFMKQKEESLGTSGKASGNKSMENFESKNGKLVCISEHFDFTAEFPGRRSFNGCNKAVERYYEQKLDDLNYRKRSEQTKSDTITDEEMLNRYETLVGLPRGPNQGKRPEAKKNTDKYDQQKKRSLDSRSDAQQDARSNSGNDSSKRKKRFA